MDTVSMELSKVRFRKMEIGDPSKRGRIMSNSSRLKIENYYDK